MDDKKAFEIALLCLEQASALLSFLKDDERRMDINQAAYHLRKIMRERCDGGGVRGGDKEKGAAYYTGQIMSALFRENPQLLADQLARYDLQKTIYDQLVIVEIVEMARFVAEKEQSRIANELAGEWEALASRVSVERDRAKEDSERKNELLRELFWALRNLKTHMDMQRETGGFSDEIQKIADDSFDPFDVYRALEQARKAIEYAVGMGVHMLPGRVEFHGGE